MSTRRDGRPSHVRPRPPSDGKPAKGRVRTPAPASTRVTPRRQVERAPGLPLPLRLAFVAAFVVLGAVVLVTAAGGLTRLAAGLGGAVDGIVDSITSTPTPAPTEAPPLLAPILNPPAESYTNQPAVDLTGTVPAQFAGQPDLSIRIDVILKDLPAATVTEVPVGPTTSFIVPGVELVKGAQEFVAVLVGAGLESAPSEPIRYVLDTSNPKVAVASPEDGTTINREIAQVLGKTQGRSTIVARNEANGNAITTEAAGDGSFEVMVPLEKGVNGITITATDPAGNAGSAVLTVRRGTGELTATVRASAYRVKTSSLPSRITITASVEDPDGLPLESAAVTFSLSIPGVPPVTFDTITDGTGRATFETTIPAGATPGTGPIVALVATEAFGQTTARSAITIVD